jgi:hypothetical protein
MKKIFLPLLGMIFLLAACGPTKDDAVNFNDKVVGAQTDCLNAESDFYKVCDGLNVDEIKTALTAFKTKVKASVMKAEATESNSDFDAYRQSAINLLKEYENMLEKEFTEYAGLYSIPTEEYTEENEARQKELADKINTSLDLLNKNFISEQKRFASKWGFTLSKY